MDKVIEIKSFTKKYGDLSALDDISIKIRPGKITGLMGPNASGKTTFLKAIAGFIRPDSGEILFDDKKANLIDKNKIAYLPDEEFIYENQSIKEIKDVYVDFFADFDREMFDKILDYFHLASKTKIKSLSKGDYKKMGLALNLSRDADIFLFDEPLDGVDPISTAKVIDLIIDKIEKGKTFIISTHQIATIENLFDDVIFLSNGAIHDSGNANSIRNDNSMDLADYYDEIYLG